MFEKEIKFIVDYNLNKIKSLGSFISFEKLASSGVHPAIVQYISAELDYLIAEDRKKLLQHSVFDYGSPEIAKYLNLISQEIKRNKKIAFEDLKKLVVQSVSFNINFLVRPRWSLTKLIFNDANSKSSAEIKLTLNYLYYNDYLKNILASYLLKRKLDALSITEFESIVSKIDKEILSAGNQKIVDYSLNEMAEFFNPGSRQTEFTNRNKDLLPLIGVEMFLKEKKMLEYLGRLKKIFPDDSKLKLGLEDIRKAMYSNISVDVQQINIEEEAEPDESFPEKEVMKEQVEKKFYEEKSEPEEPVREGNEIHLDEKESDEGIEDEKVQEELNFEESLDEELLSIYDEESKEEESQNIETESETEEPNPDSAKKNDLDSLFDFEEETNQLLKDFDEAIPKEILNEEKEETSAPVFKEDTEGRADSTLLVDDFMKQEEYDLSEENLDEESESEDEFQEEIALENSTPEKYLFDYISDKDIRKIISAVFNNDRDDFLSTVDKIGECKNYDEATEILKSVFITYRVNPYSKEAVALTNSVANFFNQA